MSQTVFSDKQSWEVIIVLENQLSQRILGIYVGPKKQGMSFRKDKCRMAELTNHFSAKLVKKYISCS